MADLVFDAGTEERRDEKFHSVPVSPKSGLPATLGGEPVAGNFPRALTELELQDSAYSLKRVFEPPQGVQNAEQ
jgi:hypothetical protein